MSDNYIDFAVSGGRKLSGKIQTNTSKNGAMGLLCASLLNSGLMCAALLNKGKTILHGIPDIEEVKRICEVLRSIGVKITNLSKNTLKIEPPKKLELQNIDKKAAGKTRTIVMFLGPLIHLFNEFSLSKEFYHNCQR